MRSTSTLFEALIEGRWRRQRIIVHWTMMLLGITQFGDDGLAIVSSFGWSTWSLTSLTLFRFATVWTHRKLGGAHIAVEILMIFESISLVDWGNSTMFWKPGGRAHRWVLSILDCDSLLLINCLLLNCLILQNATVTKHATTTSIIVCFYLGLTPSKTFLTLWSTSGCWLLGRSRTSLCLF